MALAFLMKKLDEKSRSSEHQLGLKGQIPNLLASMPVAVRGWRGKALDSQEWKTQPEGTRGCYRLEVRKPRFYQQSSAMLMLAGAEHP